MVHSILRGFNKSYELLPLQHWCIGSAPKWQSVCSRENWRITRSAVQCLPLLLASANHMFRLSEGKPHHHPSRLDQLLVLAKEESGEESGVAQ